MKIGVVGAGATGWRPAIVLVVAGLLCLAGLAVAQEQLELEAREVIMRQLAAFRAGDYRTGYSFASREIQKLFDLSAFESMVKGGYPQVADSADARVYGARRAPDGKLYLYLRIRGADGVFIVAVYEMVEEEGRWKINGVVARPDANTI